MAILWNPRSAVTAHAGRALGRWSRRQPTWRLIWLAAVVVLAVLTGFHPDVTLRSLRVPLELTVRSLGIVTLAFAAFMTLFVVINLVWALLFAWLGHRRLLLLAMIAVFLAGVALTNSLPIGVYLDWFGRQPLAPWQIQVLALLFANAMLYYFFYGFFVDIYNETKQLYVRSARFKGATVIDYLKERASLTVLASLSPLFYYMLSFTLFTDFLLQSRGVVTGIIGYLFTLITASGGGDGASGGFAAAHFWVAFAVMLTLVLPIKAALDGLRAWGARKSGLDAVRD